MLISKMPKIIQRDRSIIPACDVSTIEDFENLIKETQDIEGIGAYKIGFSLSLRYGLLKIVETARKHTSKPLIYDHQKAGTDIPETGIKFAKIMKESGIDAAILVPQAGPETQAAWTKALKENGLEVIIGGLMTHSRYLYSDGGYIEDSAVFWMYRNALSNDVTNFVVPGNQPKKIAKIRDDIIWYSSRIGKEITEPTLYAMGFGVQGGEIKEVAKVAGNYWHAIIGKGIYKSKDIRKAALEYASQI